MSFFSSQVPMVLSVGMDSISFMWMLAIGILVFLLALTMLKQWVQRLKHRSAGGIEKIDKLTGEAFEHRLVLLFKVKKWDVEVTSLSGDFGADLVGKDNQGKRVVIQAKRLSKDCGLRAVQEVLGARYYYQSQRAIVVTNREYTGPAEALAKKANVELWGRKRLIQELNKTKT